MGLFKRIKEWLNECAYFVGYTIIEFVKEIYAAFRFIGRPKYAFYIFTLVFGGQVLYTLFIAKTDAWKPTGIVAIVAYVWYRASVGDWKQSMRNKYRQRALQKSEGR